MARPREFNEHHAVAAARDQFWRDGYAGTTLDDLTQATGMGRGSLYAAFGDKHALFVRALDSYCDGALARVIDELRGADVDSAFNGLINHIRGVERRSAADTRRLGCLMAKSAAERVPADVVVNKRITKAYQAYLREVTAAIVGAQRAGDLNPHIDAGALAALVLTALRGIEAMRRIGATPATLAAAAEQLIALLPTTSHAT